MRRGQYVDVRRGCAPNEILTEARRRRRRRRRRLRRRPPRDPGWARHPTPSVWHATSASTDGVAVCVTLTSVVPSAAPAATATDIRPKAPKNNIE